MGVVVVKKSEKHADIFYGWSLVWFADLVGPFDLKAVLRTPTELMLYYPCYFDLFQYKWQICCVDMLVFFSQPTE